MDQVEWVYRIAADAGAGISYNKWKSGGVRVVKI